MSIYNIGTYYSGGYYDASQPEMSYLNYDINTTVISISTEYFDITNTHLHLLQLLPPTYEE